MQAMLTDIQTVVSQEIESISASLDELAVKIDNSYNGMLTAMNSNAEQSNQELDSKLNDLNQATSVAITRVSDDAKNVLEEFRNELQTTIQSSKDTVLNTSMEFKQSATAASESFAETKNNLIQSTKSKIQSTNESLTSKVSSVASEGRSGAEQQSTTTIDEIRGSLRGASERIVSSIDSSKSTVGDALSSASQDAKTSLSESTVAFSTAVDEVRDSTTSALSSVSSLLSNHKTESATKIQESVTSLISGVEAKLEKGSQEVEGTINDLSSRVDQTYDELKQSTSSAGDDLQSKSGSLLSSHLDLSGSELEGISSKVKQDIGDSYQQLDTQLDSLKGTLTGTIEKLEESPMIGLTEETLEEAFASPSGDEVDTQDIAERLSKVWDRVRAADFPGAKKTWNVVTRNAVNAHIKDMLSRAKSKVTLIVPEVGDIPTDVLTDLKTVVGVELVVTTTGALGPSVKPLVGKGNIRVRSRSERDVFACVRDSEEVLMAPAASTDDDVIGVVSEDDGFVKFVMSIVGPIFQAKTKLVKPEDL
jgi:DNA anti-recombination protein RmuC